MGSLPNDLVRRARAIHAAEQWRGVKRELTIKPNEVNAMVEHCRACSTLAAVMNREDMERAIRAGEMKFMDLPVRILGEGREHG